MTVDLIMALFISSVLAGAKTPETIIEMSVMDFGKIKNVPQKRSVTVLEPTLSKEYAEAVALQIRNRELDLTKCMDTDSITQESTSFLVKIRIAPTGKASAELMSEEQFKIATKIANCTLETLSKITFPPHSLKHEITVKLPLKIKRNIL